MAETVIGAALTVEGEISGSAPVVVHGKVRGRIGGVPQVLIAEAAEVDADLEADTVHVAGRVTGTVVARDEVQLTATARAHGDIRAPRILIADGAQFRGNIDMGERR